MTYHDIFNRRLVKIYKNRAALLKGNDNFLPCEIYNVILDRLSFFSLHVDNSVLILGARDGLIADLLLSRYPFLQKNKIFQSDISYYMVQKSLYYNKIVADDEKLPFKNNSFDIIISSMALHNVNNLPYLLAKIHKMLKKNGIFIGTLFGSNTLHELKRSILNGEMKTGVGPRVLPFISMQKAVVLMQQTQFINITVDTDTVNTEYKNIYNLFRDLKSMGEANVLNMKHKNFLTRKIIDEIWKYYKNHFSQNGLSIPATFEIITIQGIKV